MSSMRWTEDQLKSHLEKPGARIAASFGAGLNLRGARELHAPLASQPAHDTKAPVKAETKPKEKPLSKALLRSQSVSASVKTAIVTGHYVPGESLELVFDGAKMLSTNELYALTHFQRIEYRNAWHESIELAVMQIVGARAGQLAALQPMQRFRIDAVRYSKKLCDTDALNGFFKYPIDGLRYAGVIVDDHPRHFIAMTSTQQVGSYKMGLRVQVAGTDVPSICSTRTHADPAFFAPFEPV